MPAPDATLRQLVQGNLITTVNTGDDRTVHLILQFCGFPSNPGTITINTPVAWFEQISVNATTSQQACTIWATDEGWIKNNGGVLPGTIFPGISGQVGGSRVTAYFTLRNVDNLALPYRKNSAGPSVTDGLRVVIAKPTNEALFSIHGMGATMNNMGALWMAGVTPPENSEQRNTDEHFDSCSFHWDDTERDGADWGSTMWSSGAWNHVAAAIGFVYQDWGDGLPFSRDGVPGEDVESVDGVPVDSIQSVDGVPS